VFRLGVLGDVNRAADDFGVDDGFVRYRFARRFVVSLTQRQPTQSSEEDHGDPGCDFGFGVLHGVPPVEGLWRQCVRAPFKAGKATGKALAKPALS
jgi:hypothetical protein